MRVKQKPEEAFRYKADRVYIVTPVSPFTPVTLIYELDLDIVKMYLHTKNEASRLRLSKVRTRTKQTDTHSQTHRQTRPNALPHGICAW